MLDRSWLSRVSEEVPAFFRALKPTHTPGRYLPCLRGATPVGREMALGWSCFAAKTLHMLDRWSLLEREEREGWVDFIQEFQRTTGDCPFEDPPQMTQLNRGVGLMAKLLRLVGRGPWRPDPHSIRLAETKQA